MGQIITTVQIDNATHPERSLRCKALVDTGASHMVLPSAWKERLGPLDAIQTLEVETATQETVRGDVCGPFRIQIEGFRAIHSEVLFVDMKPEDGVYEPLIGYLVLEQSQAAVDMIQHRLVQGKRLGLK